MKQAEGQVAVVTGIETDALRVAPNGSGLAVRARVERLLYVGGL